MRDRRSTAWRDAAHTCETRLRDRQRCRTAACRSRRRRRGSSASRDSRFRPRPRSASSRVAQHARCPASSGTPAPRRGAPRRPFGRTARSAPVLGPIHSSPAARQAARTRDPRKRSRSPDAPHRPRSGRRRRGAARREVTLAGGARTEARGMIGLQHVRHVAIGVGVHGHRLDPSRRSVRNDANRDPRRGSRRAPVLPDPISTSRTGVGFQPLHGLLSCGQFEMTKRVSRSASISTYVAGCGDAVDDVETAVGGHRHVHEEVDVGCEVTLAHADASAAPPRKLSRQLCM